MAVPSVCGDSRYQDSRPGCGIPGQVERPGRVSTAGNPLRPYGPCLDGTAAWPLMEEEVGR